MHFTCTLVVVALLCWRGDGRSTSNGLLSRTCSCGGGIVGTVGGWDGDSLHSSGCLLVALLRLRGAGNGDKRKRKAGSTDALGGGSSDKRPKVDPTEAGPKVSGVVRIPRTVLKKLRAVVKHLPADGVTVAQFEERFREMHQESLHQSASTLGFAKSAALLNVLPSICSCRLPPVGCDAADKLVYPPAPCAVTAGRKVPIDPVKQIECNKPVRSGRTIASQAKAVNNSSAPPPDSVLDQGKGGQDKGVGKVASEEGKEGQVKREDVMRRDESNDGEGAQDDTGGRGGGQDVGQAAVRGTEGDLNFGVLSPISWLLRFDGEDHIGTSVLTGERKRDWRKRDWHLRRKGTEALDMALTQGLQVSLV